MDYLTDVIDKYFNEKIIGNRKEIIDYLKEYMAGHSVLDKNGKLLKRASRTTVYENLENVHSFDVVEKDSASRPTAYFFQAKDENLAKELILNMDKKSVFCLNYIERVLDSQNMGCLVTSRTYSILLKVGFKKSRMDNYMEYLRFLRHSENEVKELIWDYYLKKKLSSN